MFVEFFDENLLALKKWYYRKRSKYVLLKFHIKVNNTEATFSNFGSIGKKIHQGYILTLHHWCWPSTSCHRKLPLAGISDHTYNAKLLQLQAKKKRQWYLTVHLFTMESYDIITFLFSQSKLMQLDFHTLLLRHILILNHEL